MPSLRKAVSCYLSWHGAELLSLVNSWKCLPCMSYCHERKRKPQRFDVFLPSDNARIWDFHGLSHRWSHVRWKGWWWEVCALWILKWNCLITSLSKKVFSLSFEWERWIIIIFDPPSKIFWLSLEGKIHYWYPPQEKRIFVIKTTNFWQRENRVSPQKTSQWRNESDKYVQHTSKMRWSLSNR